MVVGSGKSGKNMIVGSKRVRSLGSNVDVTCEKAMCPHRGDGCVPEVRTNVHDLVWECGLGFRIYVCECVCVCVFVFVCLCVYVCVCVHVCV